MKVRSSVKPICEHCKVIRRRGVIADHLQEESASTSSGRGKRMARIAGVDLPRNKRVEIALTYIYGIGRSTATKILAADGREPDRRVHELSDDEVNQLRRMIENQYKVEGALRTEVR